MPKYYTAANMRRMSLTDEIYGREQFWNRQKDNNGKDSANEEGASYVIKMNNFGRKNEEIVLEKIEDSEHRKTNESEDDDV